jgi:hypothetical protein
VRVLGLAEPGFEVFLGSVGVEWVRITRRRLPSTIAVVSKAVRFSAA